MTLQTKLSLATFVITTILVTGCAHSTVSADSKNTPDSAPTASPAAVVEQDSPVTIVKNGVLKNYDTTTVGRALEGTFQNPKWTSFETPKGVTVVEFNGTVLLDAMFKASVPFDMVECLRRCRLSNGLAADSPVEVMAYKCPPATPIPVSFQFTFATDKQNFGLSYVDHALFGGHEREVMAFIYQ